LELIMTVSRGSVHYARSLGYKTVKSLGKGRGFSNIGSEVSLEKFIDESHFRGADYNNPHFTNNFRLTIKQFCDLLRRVPNIGTVSCSEYTYHHRLSRLLKDVVDVMVQPRGRVKKWVDGLEEATRQWVLDGKSIGEICATLYRLFDIRITVKGFIKYHLFHTKPPPKHR